MPSLAELAAEILAGLPAEQGEAAGGVTTWAVGDRVFAALGQFGIEIRLDPPIAAAATRTPDTAPSPRGGEWVRFNPPELDAHAVDRLRAWLELAYRRAGP